MRSYSPEISSMTILHRQRDQRQDRGFQIYGASRAEVNDGLHRLPPKQRSQTATVDKLKGKQDSDVRLSNDARHSVKLLLELVGRSVGRKTKSTRMGNTRDVVGREKSRAGVRILPWVFVCVCERERERERESHAMRCWPSQSIVHAAVGIKAFFGLGP